MKTKIFVLLVVAASLQCRADPLGENRVVIGQPSIFWHNGEWQTYKEGVWKPYGKPASNAFSQAPSKEGAVHQGGVVRRDERERSARASRGSITGIGSTTIGIGQPNGIGQSTVGIGKPNVGIGRNNTGIGQPNIGIGQPNGIGQTTIGIGKPAGFPNQQRSSSQDTTR